MAERLAAPAAFAGFGGLLVLGILVEAARDVDMGRVMEVGLLSQVVLLFVVKGVSAVPVVTFNALSVAAARADIFALFVNKIDKNLNIFVKIDAIKS